MQHAIWTTARRACLVSTWFVHKPSRVALHIATSDGNSRQYIWLKGEFGWITQTAFIQYRRGFLSTESWAEFERMQVGMLQDTLTKEWWQNRETPYSDEFVSYIDRALTDAPKWRPQTAARELSGT